jgi:Nucleotidyltransferase of unknown function (DUF6036)
VTQRDELFKTLYSILKSVAPTVTGQVEIILIGGAAMLSAEIRHRVTDDIDILSSSRGIERLKNAIRHPLQIVPEGFLCLHPDYRRDCAYVPALSLPPKILVYRLSPLDLAISKLSRFLAVDVEDIEAILKKEKISKSKLLRRYATARAYYTNQKAIDFNMKLLIKKFYQDHFDPEKDLPKPSGGA